MNRGNIHATGKRLACHTIPSAARHLGIYKFAARETFVKEKRGGHTSAAALNRIIAGNKTALRRGRGTAYRALLRIVPRNLRFFSEPASLRTGTIGNRRTAEGLPRDAGIAPQFVRTFGALTISRTSICRCGAIDTGAPDTGLIAGAVTIKFTRFPEIWLERSVSASFDQTSRRTAVAGPIIAVVAWFSGLKLAIAAHRPFHLTRRRAAVARNKIAVVALLRRRFDSVAATADIKIGDTARHSLVLHHLLFHRFFFDFLGYSYRFGRGGIFIVVKFGTERRRKRRDLRLGTRLALFGIFVRGLSGKTFCEMKESSEKKGKDCCPKETSRVGHLSGPSAHCY